MSTAPTLGGEGTWSDRDIAEGRKLTAISVKTSRAVATPLPRSAQGENAERAISILSGIEVASVIELSEASGLVAAGLFMTEG